MKMAISFISGIIACSLVIFGVRSVIPAKADTDNLTEQSWSLADLLPDIEKIYRESLTMPFIKAESKIYDEDIAEFYHELIDNTVLYQPGDNSE